MPEIALRRKRLYTAPIRQRGCHTFLFQPASEPTPGARAGEADIVVGTRSAVFAPLANLGMIVIDEEQEHTYKSTCRQNIWRMMLPDTAARNQTLYAAVKRDTAAKLS